MRKIAILILTGMLVAAIAIAPAMAGGDKVRGDNGQGDVNQVQVQDPPPFN